MKSLAIVTMLLHGQLVTNPQVYPKAMTAYECADMLRNKALLRDLNVTAEARFGKGATATLTCAVVEGKDTKTLARTLLD